MKYKSLIKFGVLLIVAYQGYAFFVNFSSSEQNTDKIRFASLAWQEQSIQANKEIVSEWNRANPDRNVEYIQGSWNSIYDYLITSFETEVVPDVFHYESSIIVDFANRGYLKDLAPLISNEMKKDIVDVAWSSVTSPSGEISGIPFMLESFIILYNKEIFDNNDIIPPSKENPWTWDNVKTVGTQLTQDTNGDGIIDQWGTAMGLRNSANFILNHAISFGGSFFKIEDGKYVVRVGDEEKALLKIIIEMNRDLKCLAPESIGKNVTEILSGFMQGRYAMILGMGNWSRQQLIENAPNNLNWGVLPAPIGKDSRSGINSQTFSIPKKSKKQKDAFDFIEFALNSKNMAKLAYSDWMIPTRKSCMEMPQFNTLDDGWKIVTSSVDDLTVGPWLGAPGYVEWKGRVANPIFQELFAGRLSIEEASKRIEIESNLVLSRYQKDK